MIVGFRHRGVERFYQSGNTSGINAQHAEKLRRFLTALDISAEPDDMKLPGARLHQLRGDRKGQWPVLVSGNWRLVFRFVGRDVTDVDYVDYH
jgi:proteic killer suppression protein